MTERQEMSVVATCGVFAILLLVVMWCINCATLDRNLKQVHTAVDGMAVATNKVFHKACTDDLEKCKADGVKKWQDCASYVECDKARADVNKAVDAIEDSLLLLDKAVKQSRRWIK